MDFGELRVKPLIFSTVTIDMLILMLCGLKYISSDETIIDEMNAPIS
jgi:hypothetical protein